MRKISLLLFVLCFLITENKAQKNLPLTVSIFNNGTMLPGTGYAGVFSKTVHPGFAVGTSYSYKSSEKNEIFQTFNIGYFYHQFSQNAIQLYSEFGYERKINSEFYAQGLLGIGYLHSFANLEQFKFKNGEYVPSGKFGRPQFMGSAALLVGYKFRETSTFPSDIFLKYQFWLQAPFVNKYVPVLPNSALHLGTHFSIFNNNN